MVPAHCELMQDDSTKTQPGPGKLCKFCLELSDETHTCRHRRIHAHTHTQTERDPGGFMECLNSPVAHQVTSVCQCVHGVYVCVIRQP